jgi:HEAT repeat protein
MLVEYLDHTNANVAVACVRILGDLRLESDVAIPALLRKLADPRQGVRIEIPLALANYGPPALTQLTNALSDPDPLIRQYATSALAKIAAAQNPTPARPSAFE